MLIGFQLFGFRVFGFQVFGLQVFGFRVFPFPVANGRNVGNRSYRFGSIDPIRPSPTW
jgi:hypothetical protein